jgi:SRSO17 transposase
MERRFEERKRDIEEDSQIEPQALAGCVRRLQQFGQPYFAHFRRSETRNNAQMFLEGLLSDLPRKNVESIAYRYEQDRRALQRFVGETDWDHQRLLHRLAEQVTREIGEEDGILVFDPSGFEKDGKKSAGVARQWLGRFGKVDNGQVGTFMAYVTRREHVLVNAKLFIPQAWNDDPARCRRAHIPEKEYRKHKTRHQHCLEMLKEQGKLLPHKWVAGDDELGKVSSFRRTLRKRKVKYVLAVPCNTTVRDLENVPKYSGRGAPPKGAFVRVDEWKKSLTDDDWQVIDVRDGEKSPIGRKLAVCRVLAHTERCRGEGYEELLIVTVRQDGGGEKYDYYLSNAWDESPEELGRVIVASHRVEDCFRRAKKECGLADYEVQTWYGWHHHVTMSLLASWFLTQETMRRKKRGRCR